MSIGTNKFKWNTNAGFLKYIFGPISHVTIHRSIHLMARASPLRHEGRCAEETSSVNHVWEEDCRSCRDAEIRFAVPLWGIFLMHVCSCVCDVCVWRVTLLRPQKSPSSGLCATSLLIPPTARPLKNAPAAWGLFQTSHRVPRETVCTTHERLEILGLASPRQDGQKD